MVGKIVLGCIASIKQNYCPFFWLFVGMFIFPLFHGHYAGNRFIKAIRPLNPWVTGLISCPAIVNPSNGFSGLIALLKLVMNDWNVFRPFPNVNQSGR